MKSFSWLLVIGWGTFVLALILAVPSIAFFLTYTGKICGFLLKCLIALQACRFFAEARRSGAWELLLSTPLTSRQILAGHWLALCRTFLWPVVTLVLLQLLSFSGPLIAVLSGMRLSPGSMQGPGFGLGFVSVSWSGLTTIADTVAVATFGTWLSISMKQPRNAAAITIVCILILPGLPVCGLDLLVSMGFFLYANSKLQQDLRLLPPQTSRARV